MVSLTINHIVASNIFDVFFNKKINNFPLVSLIDMDFTIISFYEIEKYNECKDIKLINFTFINEDELDKNCLPCSFEDGEFLILNFNTEEEAVYFNLKYCT